jgi:hypothetical protein
MAPSWKRDVNGFLENRVPGEPPIGSYPESEVRPRFRPSSPRDDEPPANTLTSLKKCREMSLFGASGAASDSDLFAAQKVTENGPKSSDMFEKALTNDPGR